MSFLLGIFQLLWGEIMDIKKQELEETLAHRKVEVSNNDKDSGIFYLKDNVNTKVVKHGNLYEDQDENEIRYAVCCPECGEIVFLDSGSRKSENTGDPESDVFSSENITYNLMCSSCGCSFKATEHIKNTAWSIIFAICVPTAVCFLSFLYFMISFHIPSIKFVPKIRTTSMRVAYISSVNLTVIGEFAIDFYLA